MTDSTSILTDQERLAELDLDQLKQLVGLVEHDPATDPFPVIGWDAAVWIVGNAAQATHFYVSAFGMELVAYSGPETGNRDSCAYVLKSGAVRFVLQGAVDPDSPLVAHHAAHGDGLVDIALQVKDVDACIAHARAQGATVLEEPHDVSDEHGTVRTAAIATYGDTRHTLVDRSRYTGPYLPGYVARTSSYAKRDGAPKRIFSGARPHRRQRRAGRHGRVGRLLRPRHGFHQHGGVRRRRHRHGVLRAHEQGRRQRQPPGEVPAQRAGARQAQVADRRVPRVLPRTRRTAPRAGHERHPAHRRRAARRGRGVPVHPGQLLLRPGAARAHRRGAGAVEELQARGILVDRDEDGYLLQIFTKPIGDRPTVFFEFIERHGSLGFGKGNFQALFEAIEREQARRGNF